MISDNTSQCRLILKNERDYSDWYMNRLFDKDVTTD